MAISTHPVDCEDGWIACWSCGGEGNYHDCGEDSCCCAEPEFDDRRDCDICEGLGGYLCPVCHADDHTKLSS